MTDPDTECSLEVDEELDATEMACPKPIICARKVLNNMSSGEVLHVTTSDSCSIKNFQSFSKQTGNDLLEAYLKGSHYHYYLRKK